MNVIRERERGKNVFLLIESLQIDMIKTVADLTNNFWGVLNSCKKKKKFLTASDYLVKNDIFFFEQENDKHLNSN